MTRLAAVVVIDTDDPRLITGTVPQQWQAVMEAIAGGGVVAVAACMDERDASAMLTAFDACKAMLGEPLPRAPVGASPRRH